MEKISAVGPEINQQFLLSAIAQSKCTNDPDWMNNIFRNTEGVSEIEVQLFLNGKEVSFTDVINDWWKRVRVDIDQIASKKAKEMVTMAGLEPLEQAFSQARHTIIEALRKVNPNLDLDQWD